MKIKQEKEDLEHFIWQSLFTECINDTVRVITFMKSEVLYKSFVVMSIIVHIASLSKTYMEYFSWLINFRKIKMIGW